MWQDFLWQIPCHSLAGYRKGCDETAFHANVQCHSLADSHRKGYEMTAIHKMCDVTHSLLVIAQMWWEWLSQNVQSHSQAVGHNKWRWWDYHHKMYNITHNLLVTGNKRDCLSQNVQCHLQPVGHKKVWWDCVSQNVGCHSLPVGDRGRSHETAFHKSSVTDSLRLLVIGKDVRTQKAAFHQISNITHILQSYEWMWWDCFSQNVLCHSLAVGHRKGCNETAFHTMCNLTHLLLAIGNCLPQNMQFYLHAVGYRKRCSDETSLNKMCNVAHKLLW